MTKNEKYWRFMKKILVALAFTLLASPCFAILSPLNQSLEEIQSIVQSTDLQKYIPQDQAIVEIQRNANGYVLKTEKMQMIVEIQYLPIERPGRQQFKLVFQHPTPIVNKPGTK
jgi:hypothetical protein